MKKILSILCTIAILLVTVLVPSSMIAYADAVPTSVIKEYAIDATAYPWGELNSIQQTFDVPKDCSGSEGYIRFQRTDASTTAQEITIYTANKTSNSYFIPYNTPGNVIQIPLETLGLTDEDLSCVTGFKVDLYYNGDNYMMWGYGITAPKAPVVTSVIKEYAIDATAYPWGAVNSIQQTFDVPKDCSGSEGYIRFQRTDASTTAQDITIYTSAKTSSVYSIPYDTPGNVIQIPLETIGLTDEDLSCVTGFKVDLYYSGGNYMMWGYGITVPKAAVVTDTIEAGATAIAPAWGSDLGYKNVTFDVPLDLSGSNGYIVVKGNATDNVAVALTIYTDTKVSNRVDIRTYGASFYGDKVPLSTFDLTDDDLKKVLGYYLEVYTNGGSNLEYAFSIHAYKPAVVSEVLEEGASVASGNWGNNLGTKSVTFDGLRDYSTNVGYVELDYSSTAAYQAQWNMGMYFKLTVYTATKTASYEPGWLAYETADVEQNCRINFSDLGLTNEDLAEVTGYKLDITQNSDSSVVNFSLKVPSVEPHVHTLGDWFSDEENHWKICTECSEIVDESAHTYDTVVTAPTCTEGGHTTYTCTVCGYSYTADETEAIGHTIGEWVSDAENHWHVCETCSVELDKAAHTASDWVVDTEATAEAAGHRHKECTVCGKVLEEEDIPKLIAHTPGDINGDGELNNKDLTRLFQYLSDWDVQVNEAALDINGDGTVNNKDLTRLFQYLSDWDVEIF